MSFINDMPDAINSMCQLFADDAKIFKSVRSNDDNKKLLDDLDSLTEWSTWWKLPFTNARAYTSIETIGNIFMKWMEKN